MSEVKKSGHGGPRANSGGPREGSGRPPNPKPVPVPINLGEKDMLTVLQEIALGKHDVTPIQLQAAIAAARYTHVMVAYARGGKKDKQADESKKASTGKFGAAAPPLKVVGGTGNA